MSENGIVAYDLQPPAGIAPRPEPGRRPTDARARVMHAQVRERLR